MSDVENERQDAIATIEDGDHVQAVQIEGYVQATGQGGLEDYWDHDGDSIMARPRHQFVDDGHPIVTVNFRQGTDALLVARMLRKIAQMLEGPARHQIVNLGLLGDDSDFARRGEGGEVDVINLRQAIAEHERQNNGGGDL